MKASAVPIRYARRLGRNYLEDGLKLRWSHRFYGTTTSSIHQISPTSDVWDQWHNRSSRSNTFIATDPGAEGIAGWNNPQHKTRRIACAMKQKIALVKRSAKTTVLSLWLFRAVMENGWKWPIYRWFIMINPLKIVIFHTFLKLQAGIWFREVHWYGTVECDGTVSSVPTALFTLPMVPGPRTSHCVHCTITLQTIHSFQRAEPLYARNPLAWKDQVLLIEQEMASSSSLSSLSSSSPSSSSPSSSPPSS